jgi:uncharacterized surface protein with fasciclin (FAS1) repeats
MKKIKNLFAVTLVTFLLTSSISCSSDDTTTTVEDNSIVGLANKTTNLSILVQALNKTGLTTTLQTTNNITVFAPTNTAFQNLLTSLGFTSLDQVPTETLKQILLNHVVATKLTASQLTTGYLKTLATPTASATNKMSLFVNKTTGVKLNGISNVSTPDIVATNGIIHIVDAVITLPTVVTFATADPNFTSLVAALTRNDQPNFVGILSGTGPFTVFAPTNAAFTSLLTEINAPSLASIPQALLEKTIKYHVVSGANVLSSTLTNNQVVTTFQGQNFTVLTTPSASIKDANNRVSNITAVDVQANNGVIHVLNKVLLAQ